MKLDSDALANEHHRLYLQIAAATVLPLKGRGFKIENVSDETVGDKPAVALKATGPDGRDFTLSFDKQSGLPVKLVAAVKGFQGEDYIQETTYSDYKDFGGIRRATKVEYWRAGMKFGLMEITDFKVLDAVEPGTFDQPK
jgi:hypothetical protein